MKETKFFKISSASKTALIYAAFGIIWILGSDLLFSALIKDQDVLMGIGIIKGIIYVFVTALLVFFLVYSLLSKIVASEEKLREQNEHFKLALESGMTGIWSYNFETKVLYLNKLSCEILGLTDNNDLNLEDFLSKFSDPYQKELKIKIENIIKYRDEDYFSNKVVLQNKKWIRIFGKSHYNSSGEPEILIGLLKDITVTIQNELAIEESEKRLKYAFDVTNDGIWDWNISQDSAYLSPQYYRILGYEPNEFPIKFKEIIAKVHPEDREEVMSKMLMFVEYASKFFGLEFRMIKKDGTPVWIFAKGKLCEEDKNGKATRMVGIITDITLQKDYEKKLLDAKIEAEKSGQMINEYLIVLLEDINKISEAVNQRNLDSLPQYFSELFSELKDHSDILNKKIKNNKK